MANQFDLLFKVVLIGEFGVGKTSILNRFLDDTFLDSPPTPAITFAHKLLRVHDSLVKVQLWDIPGREDYLSMIKGFYRGADGAFIVYDQSQEQTFSNVQKWLSYFREMEPDKRVVLLENKSDLEERAVEESKVEEYVRSNDLLYRQVSALSGENVTDAFNALIKGTVWLMKRSTGRR